MIKNIVVDSRDALAPPEDSQGRIKEMIMYEKCTRINHTPFVRVSIAALDQTFQTDSRILF